MRSRSRFLLVASAAISLLLVSLLYHRWYDVGLVSVGVKTSRNSSIVTSSVSSRLYKQHESRKLASQGDDLLYLDYQMDEWILFYDNKTMVSDLPEFHYQLLRMDGKTPGNAARGRAYQRHVPDFHCPDQERVGFFGDGGKWVCQPRQLLVTESHPCIVYSFGSNLQFTFEEHIQLISQDACQVHIFDPTPSVVNEVKRNPNLPKNIFFHPWAVGDRRSGKDLVLQGQKITEIYTFAEIMKKLGHLYLDILKIDVEGSEWHLFMGPQLDLTNISQEDAQLFLDHRIGQLQLEVHTNMVPNEKNGDLALDELFDLFQKKYHLKLFHTEPNEYTMGCWELAFIDPRYKVGDRTIQQWIENHPYPASLREKRYLESSTKLKAFQDHVMVHDVRVSGFHRQAFHTWMQEAVDVCDALLFLGNPDHGPTLWCNDAFKTNPIQLVSFWDHAYLLDDPSERFPSIQVHSQPDQLLRTRLSWLHDLSSRFHNQAVIHVMSGEWKKDTNHAMKKLTELLNSYPDTNALHVSLSSTEMFIDFVRHVLPELSVTVQLLLVDGHFCQKCYKGQPTTASITDWGQAYLDMTLKWKVVWKQMRVNDLSPEVGYQDEGHYQYVMKRIE